jgi:MoaA/NifB/PqqE/SkfB family radical SAM enzyme
MKIDNLPKRVIINFTKKCALNCEWCYVHFDSQSISRDKLIAVIERVSYLGFDSITFGGGDPFQYKYLSTVITKTKELGLFVHIDTHAITLSESYENAVLLENSVDLIGLPLDGSTRHIHDLMRSSVGHYKIIKNKLEWIKSHDISIKLNTIVSSVNKEDLKNLSKLILNLQPVRWSIYQFWPVGPATKSASKHILEDKEFLEGIRKIDFRAFENITTIEVNTAESRRSTYPILNHNGEVYIHHEYPTDGFQYVGSIFDKGILAKIGTLCNQEREQATSRYIENKNVRKAYSK